MKTIWKRIRVDGAYSKLGEEKVDHRIYFADVHEFLKEI